MSSKLEISFETICQKPIFRPFFSVRSARSLFAQELAETERDDNDDTQTNINSIDDKLLAVSIVVSITICLFIPSIQFARLYFKLSNWTEIIELCKKKEEERKNHEDDMLMSSIKSRMFQCSVSACGIYCWVQSVLYEVNKCIDVAWFTYIDRSKPVSLIICDLTSKSIRFDFHCKLN